MEKSANNGIRVPDSTGITPKVLNTYLFLSHRIPDNSLDDFGVGGGEVFPLVANYFSSVAATW